MYGLSKGKKPSTFAAHFFHDKKSKKKHMEEPIPPISLMVSARTRPSLSWLQGTRKFGERLRAESQGYGGWVRVVQEDGGGWMLRLGWRWRGVGLAWPHMGLIGWLRN